jgi:hypothetical protein
MDRDEISNPYRGPAIDASHQVSDHLGKQFQRRRILKISQSETRIACGSHVCQWRQTWPPSAMLVSDWLISKNLLL